MYKVLNIAILLMVYIPMNYVYCAVVHNAGLIVGIIQPLESTNRDIVAYCGGMWHADEVILLGEIERHIHIDGFGNS